MSYMENHFDKRLDPRLLVDDAKSVISLSYNYYPSKLQNDDTYKIAKYAYGEDYHHVIKSKLKTLSMFIKDHIGDVNGRAFVDSAPLMERTWAQKSGIGWGMLEVINTFDNAQSANNITVLPNSASDLNLILEASDDLVNWTREGLGKKPAGVRKRFYRLRAVKE